MMQSVDGHAGHLERDASERDKLPRINESHLHMNLWRPTLDCMRQDAFAHPPLGERQFYHV